MTARWWWMSCRKMTVAIGVDSAGLIVESPPITRKFVGQHVENLTSWMRSLGGFAASLLHPLPAETPQTAWAVEDSNLRPWD